MNVARKAAAVLAAALALDAIGSAPASAKPEAKGWLASMIEPAVAGR